MARRIDIELTSARPDGTWTWRAAGAREPKGVIDGAIVPAGGSVGDVLKVEAEMDVDGITVVSVVSSTRQRKEPSLLPIIAPERPFEGVTQQLARPLRDGDERGDRRRRDRDDGDRRDRRDRPGGDRGDRGPRSDRPAGDRSGPQSRDRSSGDRSGPPRGDRPGGPRPDRPGGQRGDRPGGPRPDGDRHDRGPRPPRERREPRPHFAPPPEMPQRPKPKRLKPGRAHRTEVLASIPEEQRPIAELTLQGLAAVRQRLRDDNEKLKQAGKPEMPEASVMKMAEELMPKVRVAEWLDRADAAKADLELLDLRDLRSVVASADDTIIARDENARTLAAELKAALLTRQETATQEWLEDIGTAIDIGRIVRALKMSAEPPKAGTRFPVELGLRLADAASASLTTDASSDRWLALIETVAFSPVRTQVRPSAPPNVISDELRSAVQKLAAAIPQIAALFGIEVAEGAPLPKPPRVVRRPERKGRPDATGGPPRPPKPERADRPARPEPAAEVEQSPAAPAAEAEPQPAQPEAAEPEAAPEPEAAAEPQAATEPEASSGTEEPALDAAPEPDASEREAEAQPQAAADSDPEPEPEREPRPERAPEADPGPDAAATDS
jgi:hypothetical protein